MIKINDKANCCGCSACLNICPRSCIVMVTDDEGFQYPEVNEDLCVKCGLCERACPQIEYTENNTSLKSMAVQCCDQESRARSTAGGGFTPIAKYVLEHGGIVFGAAYNSEYEVGHIGVEKTTELFKLQGSKYVQSVLSNTYKNVLDNLKKERMVLFSGTPCQVAGLYTFLKASKVPGGGEKLLTVSVACRAVPSPLIFKKYIEMQKEAFHGEICDVRCRDKFYGYSYSTMSVYSSNKNIHSDYHCSVESDEWLRCFFSGVCDRPCCDRCHFRGIIGDFQIGDYFRVGDTAPELDDNRGTTRMVIGSEKGLEVFNRIENQYRYKGLSNTQLKKTTQNALSTFGKDKDKRKVFFEDANKLSGKELFNKYYPRTVKVKLLQYGRFITYRLGIYGYIKKALMKLKCKR